MKADPIPTLDDYFKAADALAKLVRQTLAKPGSVPKAKVKKVLETFETINQKAMM